MSRQANTPSLEQWKRLYELMDEVKGLAPWDFMLETDLFGIRFPGTDELGFVSVDEVLKQYTDEIMCHIAALLPEKYRGFYADHPRLKELLAGDAKSFPE